MTVGAKNVNGRSGTQPVYDIASWRRRIPILETHVLMNNCSQAPQLDVTRRAAEEYLDSWNHAGMDWDAWMAETHRAKEEFARLINASPDDIAVSSSVSEVTASLASALDFSGERRRVVTTEAEFPSIAHVWQAHAKYGLEIGWVPLHNGIIRLEDYESAVDERTLLVSASHAYYQNGYVQDIAAIARKAHAQGALIYVDAYQTLGTRPVDVRAMDIDFLASGNLKYLLGVPGIAFLYVRPDLVEGLEPAVTGWFGRANPYAFDVRGLDWPSTAARFDTGTPPVVNAYVSRAGMAVINEVEPVNIQAWTEILTARLIEGGRARGLTLYGTEDPTSKTPSTAFVCPEGESHHVEELLRHRGILAAARGPVIRLAPHFYNTVDDVDQALDALQAVLEDLPGAA
ncbi:MAG: aminotransferase class V-fold PLP-dependent enzyme [Thermoleophilia bacterium]